jgi:hypothetical protein
MLVSLAGATALFSVPSSASVAAGGSTTLSPRSSKATSQALRTYLVDGLYHRRLVQPPTVRAGEAGIHTTILGLRWRNWGTSSARATGHGQACISQGPCVAVAIVTVVVDRRVHVDCGLDSPSPAFIYTRVRASFTLHGATRREVGEGYRDDCGAP